MSISGFLRVSWFIKSVISFTVTQHQQWLCEPSRGYIIKTLSFEPQCCLFLREDDLKFRWATLFMRHRSKLTFHRITIVIWEELLTSAPPLGSVFRFKKKILTHDGRVQPITWLLASFLLAVPHSLLKQEKSWLYGGYSNTALRISEQQKTDVNGVSTFYLRL